MEALLQSISTNIHNNEKIKNIDDLVKNYHNINNNIDEASKMLQSLKTKIEEEDDDSLESYNDKEFEKCKNEMEVLIKKFMECMNLEEQIEIYKKINRISNECMHYLEKKKLVIIECDKTDFTKKEKNKKKLYSSSSDDDE
jgi:hypothetical protein